MSWKIERLYHTIVNAKDLDETIAFYKTLGFEVLHDRRHMEWPDFVGIMFGIGPARAKGVLMNLPSDPYGPMLDIVQWVDPEALFPGTAGPIPRVIAFKIANLAEAYKELKAKGVPFTTEMNEPGKGGIGNVVAAACCRDPNGNIIELIELIPGVRHSLDRPQATS